MTEEQARQIAHDVFEARLDEVRREFGRQQLGSAEHDQRLDCCCGQCVGLLNTNTGEVVAGYSGFGATFQPAQNFGLRCRRCHKTPLFSPSGERIADHDSSASEALALD